MTPEMRGGPSGKRRRGGPWIRMNGGQRFRELRSARSVRLEENAGGGAPRWQSSGGEPAEEGRGEARGARRRNRRERRGRTGKEEPSTGERIHPRGKTYVFFVVFRQLDVL